MPRDTRPTIIPGPDGRRFAAVAPWVAAVHESGHALGAIYQGVPVGRVIVDPTAHVYRTEWQKCDPKLLSFVYAAGIAAQRTVCGRTRFDELQWADDRARIAATGHDCMANATASAEHFRALIAALGDELVRRGAMHTNELIDFLLTRPEATEWTPPPPIDPRPAPANTLSPKPCYDAAPAG